MISFAIYIYIQSSHLVHAIFLIRILAQPDAQAKLIDNPVWVDDSLIPPDSFEILLQLTFPDSSAKVAVSCSIGNCKNKTLM